MVVFKKLINWFLGLFQKSETPHLDKKIAEKKAKIKKLDKKLEEEYSDVDASMEEWEL